VPIDDADALAGALTELTRDATQRVAWGQHGQVIARTKFSIATMITRYEQLYESVMT
jgi:glycosyltransferase involved in cell wall biosynthesis